MDPAAPDGPHPKENFIEIEIPNELFHYLSNDQCNLDIVCRICLSIHEETMYPLFTHTGEDDSVSVNMIKALSEVQINEDDGLPNNICENCQKELLSCYDFKNKCIKADYTLKSVLKGKFVNNIKEEEALNDSVAQEILREDEEINYEIKLEPEEKYASPDPENLLFEIVPQSKVKKKSKKKSKHSCSICPRKFCHLKSLRAHTAKHHKGTESLYPCTKCKEGFNSEFDLVLHGMLHTPGPNWTCTECHKEFKGRTAFRRHIRRHMQCKRYSCEVCGKTFVELCALRRHARIHAPVDDENKLPCRYCNKRFSSKSSLATHERAHSGRREHACACGKRFNSARLLASHARTHSDLKPHACRHCAKRFRHESTRNTHQRTHTGERPYACALCARTFIQRSNLTLHMRTHTGERPYKCSHCDSKFSSGSTLKAHERTHTGERPYSCKICGKSFGRLNVKLHMRTHTGERPHACARCPRRFISAARLRDHQRVHTGEKPFECNCCSSKFATKSHLIKHCRTHDRLKTDNKGVLMYMPVTVTDKSINETDPTQYVIVAEPNKLENTLEAQDDCKTEVIVVDAEQNVISNGIAYVNDLNCTSNMELVTVNEEEMSVTTGNAVIEGTTVQVYQYDQSLVHIHSGGGQLTISRISSKMTANLM